MYDEFAAHVTVLSVTVLSVVRAVQVRVTGDRVARSQQQVTGQRAAAVPDLQQHVLR